MTYNPTNSAQEERLMIIRRILALTALSSFAACTTTGDDTTGFVQATYDAELSGAAVAGTGDPDGAAVAQLTVTRDTDAVCYNVWNVSNIGAATGAHIHRGLKGQNGPVVAPLERGDGHGWNGCIERTGLADEMLSSGPQEYYVQIHTFEYPNGAIRGQLSVD